jgi:sec-independent protein translocase protein TatA
MGALSIWHVLLVVIVVVLLFGRGKISGVMGDVAHGIRNFREGLKDPVEPRELTEREREADAAKRTEETRR